MTFFDTRNGFPGSGRGSGRIKVYKRMLTGSPLLSPPPPPPPSTLSSSLFHLPAISVSLERATFHSTKSPWLYSTSGDEEEREPENELGPIGQFRIAQASVSKRDWVRTHWNENHFPFSFKWNSLSQKGFALNFVLKIRGLELGNGLLDTKHDVISSMRLWAF